MKAQSNPFTVARVASNWKPLSRAAFRLLTPVLDRLFGLSELRNRYEFVTSHGLPPKNSVEFLERLHRSMGVSTQVRDESLRRIPKSGSLVVVANHPFGGIEATTLLCALSKVRPDVKFLANFILGSIPETKDFSIYVNPFGGENAFRQNLQPLKDAINWVHDGGVLCLFPAGTVSHFQFRNRKVTDPVWSATAARMIRKTTAPVLPVYFSGSNGLLFQAAGLIHPLLRTMFLPREFINKRETQIRLKVGNLIPFEKLNSYKSDDELITYLRLRTYILGNETGKHTTSVFTGASAFRKMLDPLPRRRKIERIAPAASPEVLAAEVERLPSRQMLSETGEMAVYYARAKQIPNLLREIGRMREISFREVNEGTGHSVDLDHFDSYYTHLFVWHRGAKDLVGAYRLAKTDKVLRHLGKNGLYSSTLFDYRTPLLEQIGPAIELGRSFIRREYQRNYSSLLLLWKGIGQYVLRFPRYRILFGPVSINNEYNSVSRELITLFLRANNYLPELAKLIKARNPVSHTRVFGMDIETTSFVVKDLRDVSDLLADVESQQKAVPILLRQYLRLGGKLLGFNIDKNFGDVLDGLIFVDLLETELNLLERYMGRDGAQQFLAAHQRGAQNVQNLA